MNTGSGADRSTAGVDGHRRAGRLRGVPATVLAGPAMIGVVLLWGLGPPVSKLISAPALVAVFCRMWFSVPVLLVWLYASGNRLSVPLLRLTAPAGVVFGINMCFVFTAFHHASIATLSVMSALQPGVVLLVAGPLLGERPTSWHRSWTAVGIGGAVLVILAATGKVGVWGWIGLLPLATGALGWCPPYSLLGINTCKNRNLPG